MKDGDKIQQLILAGHWCHMALRGLLTAAFGVAILVWPVITIDIIVILFGVFAFTSGTFNVLAAIRYHAGEESRGVFILQGIAGIMVGIVTFVYPAATEMALFFLIVIWAMVTGILEILVALRLPPAVNGKMLIGVSGVLSVMFALVLLVRPWEGVLVVIWIIGFYAVLVGAMLIGLSFILCRMQRAVRTEIR